MPGLTAYARVPSASSRLNNCVRRNSIQCSLRTIKHVSFPVSSLTTTQTPIFMRPATCCTRSDEFSASWPWLDTHLHSTPNLHHARAPSFQSPFVQGTCSMRRRAYQAIYHESHLDHGLSPISLRARTMARQPPDPYISHPPSSCVSFFCIEPALFSYILFYCSFSP